MAAKLDPLDQADEHLSRFYAQEMPTPWPDAPTPIMQRTLPNSTASSRSRLTLLACLSLVAAGAVGMVQLPQPNNVASESLKNPLEGATADGKGVLEPKHSKDALAK